MGYSRAGFDVTGVDIKPQPDYPFPFIQADALELSPSNFDFIHASPPCQNFTRAKHLRDAQNSTTKSVNLIPPTRALLKASGIPYVIENVPGAPLENPIQLCGSVFNLKVRRHRWFESSLPIVGSPCAHKEQGRPVGVYHVMNDDIPQGGRTARTLEEGQQAMGISWLPWSSLKEAVPPAYTEYIGHQIAAQL